MSKPWRWLGRCGATMCGATMWMLPMSLALALAALLGIPTETRAQPAAKTAAKATDRAPGSTPATNAATSLEAQWMRLVPPTTHFVIRLNALGSLTSELKTMFSAMSPTMGERYNPMVDTALEQLRDMVGREALPLTSPTLILVTLSKDPEAALDVTVIMGLRDHQKFRLALSGNAGDPPPIRPGEATPLELSMGFAAYTIQGPNFVAVGGTAEVLNGLLRPVAAQAPASTTVFLNSGDIAVWVNAEAMTQTFGEQIDKFQVAMTKAARKLRGGANAAAPDAGTVEGPMYANLFAGVKHAKTFTMTFNIDPKAVYVSADLTFKSPLKGFPQLADTGSTQVLTQMGRLPANLGSYIGFSGKTAPLARSLGMMLITGTPQDGAANAILAKTKEQTQTAGIVAMAHAVRFNGGLQNVTLTKAAKPDVLNAVTKTSAATDKITGNGAVSNATFKENVFAYQGMNISNLVTTFDMAKLMDGRESKPSPVLSDSLKTMFHNGVLSSWMGVKDQTHIAVTAKDWPSAKILLDATLQGVGPLAKDPGFLAFQGLIPARGDVMFAISSQGLLGMLSTMSGVNPTAKMPATNVYLGASVLVKTDGYILMGAIPVTIGPMIENGFIPVVSKILESRE